MRGSDVRPSRPVFDTGVYFLPFLSLGCPTGGDLLLSSLVAPLSIRLVSIPVSSERSELVSPLLIREESSFPDTDLS